MILEEKREIRLRFSWKHYVKDSHYDEWIGDNGRARPWTKEIAAYIRQLSASSLVERQIAADLVIKGMGVNFRVYHHESGDSEYLWPFDLIPRIVSSSEWFKIEEGLKQRILALNLFIQDVYNHQHILKAKKIPKSLVFSCPHYLPFCQGISPPLGIWSHISGSDLIRHDDGKFYVLEDNLRVPSGVSYMLENRLVTKRIFPELFEHYAPLPIDTYPSLLFETLSDLTPIAKPEIVVLTPGIYNSAYFEHSYLAQQMGCELVEGSDLFVDTDDRVMMKTIEGLKPVDVIYRRIDDEFLDPQVFRKDSLLGVQGLMRAWAKGNVTLVNAPGSGIGDDKAIFAYVPEMIRFYLGEEPKLANTPTYLCECQQDKRYTLSHLDSLVVKPTNASGGQGIFVGLWASQAEQKTMAEKIKANPRYFIAQPLMNLSTVPTLIQNKLEPRRVDLRPFVLSGVNMAVTAGGLTRVALPKDSFVVNSSQGGGSKDTWIIDVEK